MVAPAIASQEQLSWVRETNRAIEIQAVESPRNETRRRDVFRGRPTDRCLPREGVPGGQYRADRSLLTGRRNHQPQDQGGRMGRWGRRTTRWLYCEDAARITWFYPS